MGAIVLVVIGALLVVRRRRANPGRPGSAPHPGEPVDGPTRAIRTSEPSHGSES
ncbi:hypothetical protein FHX44_111755 [Pseudonocardia hierapolitana]|uniref:Uncharacterized protein n=1 Tax=Pseudonocardia hierapolitana TaxID=1128676 RepID=A0A561SLX3_9PSEU|nr:hypothetical protein [Pseudonocardia hierapolitana]TWF75870.1 hypothetical protein FHX44_111755 [Pseudonocardia hierapolitana]